MQQVGNVFYIANNPALSTCQVDALRKQLQAIPGGYSGTDDSCCNQGCTACTGPACTGTAGGPTGQSGIYNGSLVISTAADLQTLSTVTEIDGDLTINSTQLANLTGLNNLTHITGSLSIYNNSALTNLVSASEPATARKRAFMARNLADGAERLVRLPGMCRCDAF